MEAPNESTKTISVINASTEVARALLRAVFAEYTIIPMGDAGKYNETASARAAKYDQAQASSQRF